MRNQKGFMGCSTIIIFIWAVFILSFWAFISLNKNIFYQPPIQEQILTLTSRVASKRCRQKLELFNANENIKQITLNELEVNSALHD